MFRLFIRRKRKMYT